MSLFIIKNRIINSCCSKSFKPTLINNCSLKKFFSSTSAIKLKNEKLFVTTPIFYVNSYPHIGHLYSALLADAYYRFKQLNTPRDNSIFSTGTDEHGMKIEKSLKKGSNTTLEEHCTIISDSFKNMCQTFNINCTDFIRTTEKRHMKATQHFWNELYSNGHITKGTYEGWYSIQDENFITNPLTIQEINKALEGQSRNDKIEMQIEEVKQQLEFISEENYMFNLGTFKEEIIKWIKLEKPIFPEKFSAYVLSALNNTDEKNDFLSISRPKSRLSWGIPVPNDENQVIYVWLDALVNYLTVAGYPSNSELMNWPPTLQVVGKDILKFHAIYWPSFLLAAGLKLPKKILCHSHWTVDNIKMSKSIGNVVDPFNLISEKGIIPEGVRYFLLREGTPHSDSNYNETKMINLLNAELADTLGNLLNRSSSKSLNPKQSWPPFNFETGYTDFLFVKDIHRLIVGLEILPDKVSQAYEECNFYKGIEYIMESIRQANLVIQQEKPWELAKKNINDQKLQDLISLIMETLRITSTLLIPIVPNISYTILDRLNVPKENRNWNSLRPFIWEKNSNHVSVKNLCSSQEVLFKKIKI